MGRTGRARAESTAAYRRLVPQVVARYRGAPPGVRFYLRGKLWSDPISRFVAETVGRAPRLLDLGCGLGQNAILAVLAGAGEAVGVDADGERLDHGARAAAGLPVRFVRGDAREVDLEPADVVCMADMLHYLPLAAQEEMLRRAARAVRPGGRLWLREMVGAEGWRSALGISVERALAGVGWHRFAPGGFPGVQELLGRCAEEGLVDLRVAPLRGWYPYSNVLLEARRPPAPGAGRGAGDD